MPTRVISKAVYKVPQNSPTPRQTSTAAMIDPKGVLPNTSSATNEYEVVINICVVKNSKNQFSRQSCLTKNENVFKFVQDNFTIQLVYDMLGMLSPYTSNPS